MMANKKEETVVEQPAVTEELPPFPEVEQIMSLTLEGLKPDRFHYLLELGSFATNWDFRRRTTAIWARDKKQHYGWVKPLDSEWFVLEVGMMHNFREILLDQGTDKQRLAVCGDAVMDPTAWANLCKMHGWNLNVYGYEVVGVVT